MRPRVLWSFAVAACLDCGGSPPTATPVAGDRSQPESTTPTTAPAHDTMTTIEESDLAWRHATESEEKSATVPAVLQFAFLDAETRVEADAVVLTGELRNPTDRATDVVIFPVDDRSPFWVQVVLTPDVAMAPSDGPPLPPEPPRGRVLTIPGRTAVRFHASIVLTDYVVRTHAGMQAKWLFHFWASPHPSGEWRLSDAQAKTLDGR